MNNRSVPPPIGSALPLEWRPIPGWPEYEVSAQGDVRRVQGGRGAQSGRILRPWINAATGYRQVSLWRHNQHHRMTVHRLVALGFHGEPTIAGAVVAHNDGNRLNNCWNNLRWATQAENVADTLIHGTHNRGTRNGQARLDEISVKAIRRMVSAHVPRSFAAEGFGICRQSVDDIVNRKRWRHVP